MAQKARLKGAKSARDSFGPLYNKIVAGKFGGAGGDDAAAAAAAGSSPAKGSPSKRKGVVYEGDDGGEGEDEISPPKKAKGKKGSATPRKGKGQLKGKGEVKADVDAGGEDGKGEGGDDIVVKTEVLDGDGDAGE